MLCQHCWLNVQCCQGTCFIATFCCIMEVHFEVYQGSFVETFQGYVRHCMSDIRKNFLGVNVTGTPGIRCNALPGNSFLLDLLHFFKWARANYHVSTYIVRFPPFFTSWKRSLTLYQCPETIDLVAQLTGEEYWVELCWLGLGECDCVGFYSYHVVTWSVRILWYDNIQDNKTFYL